MEEYEVYNKYFIDEEYDLDNSPSELHSFRSGWNAGLKRASRLLAKELRPEGQWLEIKPSYPYPFKCSVCGHMHSHKPRYCSACGALNNKEVTYEKDNLS